MNESEINGETRIEFAKILPSSTAGYIEFKFPFGTYRIENVKDMEDFLKLVEDGWKYRELIQKGL